MTNKIVPLRNLIEEHSEQGVNEILSCFSCSKDDGVQKYLRKTAVKHESSHISRTYLIFDSEETERLVAYVTVATKCLVIGSEQPDEILLKQMNVNNGVAQSYRATGKGRRIQ